MATNSDIVAIVHSMFSGLNANLYTLSVVTLAMDTIQDNVLGFLNCYFRVFTPRFRVLSHTASSQGWKLNLERGVTKSRFLNKVI
jgi:hypothetical protein